MKPQKAALAAAVAISTAMLPSIAFAHPGHFHQMTLLTGIAHPLTGLDHILAMTSVGLWAAQKGGRALWVWPSAFVAVMLAGGVMGMEGIALPLVEPAIAASILVLGLMVAGAAQAPLWAGAALIGAFAFFHGNAHGLEAPEAGSTALYALGFVVSTAALHGAGLALGLASRADRWQTLLRVGGALTAGIGGLLFFV